MGRWFLWRFLKGLEKLLPPNPPLAGSFLLYCCQKCGWTCQVDARLFEFLTLPLLIFLRNIFLRNGKRLTCPDCGHKAVFFLGELRS